MDGTTLDIIDFREEFGGVVDPARPGSVKRYSGRVVVGAEGDRGGEGSLRSRVTIDIATCAFSPSSLVRLRFAEDPRRGENLAEYPYAMRGVVLTSEPEGFVVTCSGLMAEVLKPPSNLCQAFAAKSDVYVLLRNS